MQRQVADFRRSSALKAPGGSELQLGQFYWMRPALDVDAPHDWQCEDQPARFSGFDDEGREVWFFLGMEGAIQWPAAFVLGVIK